MTKKRDDQAAENAVIAWAKTQAWPHTAGDWAKFRSNFESYHKNNTLMQACAFDIPRGLLYRYAKETVVQHHAINALKNGGEVLAIFDDADEYSMLRYVAIISFADSGENYEYLDSFVNFDNEVFDIRFDLPLNSRLYAKNNYWLIKDNVND